MRILLLAPLALAAAYLLYVGLPTVIGYALRASFLRRLAESWGNFLTFDDGPSEELTPLILAALARGPSKATFFLVGRNAEAHPEIVRQAVKQGHQIGEHTYSHRHPWTTGPLATLRDLARSEAVMKRFAPDGGSILFRPPYGKLNLVILLYVLFRRRRLVYWNIDPRDYRARRPQELLSRVLPPLAGRRRGSCVLLHDGRPDGSGAPERVAALGALLDSLHSAGIGFQHLSRLFNGGPRGAGD